MSGGFIIADAIKKINSEYFFCSKSFLYSKFSLFIYSQYKLFRCSKK